MENLRPLKAAYSVLSICLIGVGLLLSINPLMEEPVLYRICGIVLLVFGVVKIAGYFSKDIFQLAFQFDLAMGVISSIIGVILIFHTTWPIGKVSVCMGIFMLADALLKLQTTIDAKKFGIEKWWMMLLMAVPVAVIGVLLLILQFESNTYIMKLLGLNLCIDGILNFLTVQSTVRTMNRRRDKWEA